MLEVALKLQRNENGEKGLKIDDIQELQAIGNEILELPKILFEEEHLLMSETGIKISVFLKKMTVKFFKYTNPIPQKYCQNIQR